MPSAEPDPYELLGVAQDASDRAIHSAWRARIKQCHPDNAVDDADREAREARSVELNLAKEILLDPHRRADLDLARPLRRDRARDSAWEAGAGRSRGSAGSAGSAAGTARPDGNGSNPEGFDQAWFDETWSKRESAGPTRRHRLPEDDLEPYSLVGDVLKVFDFLFSLVIRATVAAMRRFNGRGGPGPRS
jgi:curved DNA-binding protein CbpA